MKKNIFLATLLLVLGASEMGFAQTPQARSGIRVGVNASNLYVEKVTDRNPRYGLHAALFKQIPLAGNLFIQPEIGYSAKGMTARYDLANSNFKGENSFNLDYAELPVLLTYKVGNTVDLHAGAYAAYLLRATNNSKNELSSTTTKIDRENYNALDYGLSAGLSVYFGKVMVGTRYNYGLNSVAKTDAAKLFLGDSKNSTGQVSIGYTF